MRHRNLLPAHDRPVVDAKDGRSLLARCVAAAVLAVREDEYGGRVFARDRDRDDPSRARQEAVPQGDVGVGPQAERTGALHEHRRTREQASSASIVVRIEPIAPGMDDTLRRRRRIDSRGGRSRRESQGDHGASDEGPHWLTIRQCIVSWSARANSLARAVSVPRIGPALASLEHAL